jgi:hypothetical protein
MVNWLCYGKQLNCISGWWSYFWCKLNCYYFGGVELLWYGVSTQDELQIEFNLMHSYLVIIYVFF